MNTISIIKAFIGNPLFKDATPETRSEYDALNERLREIPNVQYVCLYADKVVAHFNEGKRTFKYPKDDVTPDWLHMKIAMLSGKIRNDLEWKGVPLSVERFCKQATELCRKGGTVNYENGEYVLRWRNYTARWGAPTTDSRYSVAIGVLEALRTESAELERLRVLAQKHGLE